MEVERSLTLLILEDVRNTVPRPASERYAQLDFGVASIQVLIKRGF